MLASVAGMYNWYFDFVSSILPLLGPWISWRLHLERDYIYLLLRSINISISWRWKAMKQKIHLGRWSCTLQLDTFNFLENNFCPAFWLLGTHDAEKVKAKQSTIFWFYLKYLKYLIGWFFLLLCGPEDSLNDNSHVRDWLLQLALGRNKCRINF